jgi:DinB superfamily
MNPYASYLNGQDPAPAIKATTARLKEMFDQIGVDRVDVSPAPGKWSPREILCHLADTEIAFAFRIRQGLAEPNHVIQPFDQEKWALNYRVYAVETAFWTFASLRDWNVTLISSVPPEAMESPITHPERGQMTFRVLVETMAGHDLNHLQQLERFLPRQQTAAG